ncbi:MAG: hypothetical protein KBG28_01085 [Kofleriaceae bacterium]|nr:hypothetical protein [Kofleriaceae bacterium]MBP6838703.1 hypothetical protein [Kofleriaceae bacterium]MBP9202545.1 hypothetical protein [Kofleriaceae bacterium]
MALEHVAQGQTRFQVPGVAPDPRGIVLGRYLMLAFPTLEGVVSWFRLYSAEASLDELMAGLELVRGRTPLASRDLLLRIPAVSSHTCDRAARLARLVGGTAYTGTAKHFVKYRDDRSPYGYDAVDVASAPAQADVVLHADDFVQSYQRQDELPFDRLLFRLSIRPLPGGARAAAAERGELLVAVARGLVDGVVRYLWRNRVAGKAALVRPQDAGAFAGDTRAGYLLLQVSALPERILELFLGVPGIDVFRAVSANAAVAVGHAHPIDLASCASVLPADRFFLFWPGDRVDALPGPLEMSDLAHLTRLDLELDRPREASERTTGAPDPVGVTLRLAPGFGPPRRVNAALIPAAQAGWLKRLVFLLPPASLRGHRVAVTDRGLLVVGASNVDIIPLGRLLCEVAPGLLVPLGMDVVPRVSPEVLARALGHTSGLVTVFADDRPFQVADSALIPLERRAIAQLEVERAEVRDVAVPPATDPRVVNDPVGQFALWGFPDPDDRKLLP